MSDEPTKPWRPLELLYRSVECSGDLDKALDWLQSPECSSEGSGPVRLAATRDGRQAVLHCLAALQ